MWIFTKHGFYSVTKNPVRKHLMQVRARCRQDLQNLKTRFGLTGEIMETPQADYRWRLLCRPATWHALAEELAKDVDYGNFKASVGHDQHDKPLMKVWSAMNDFQRQRHPEQFNLWSDDQWLDDDPDEWAHRAGAVYQPDNLPPGAERRADGTVVMEKMPDFRTDDQA